MPLFNGIWVNDSYVEAAKKFWGPNAEQILASQHAATDAQSAERYRLYRDSVRDRKKDFAVKSALMIGTAGLASGAFGAMGAGGGAAAADGLAPIVAGNGSSLATTLPGGMFTGAAAAPGLGGVLGSTAARMAIPMGVSAMSGKGGGGGSGDAAAQQAQLAQLLAMQSNPLRQQLIDRSGAFMGGNLDVTQSPMYGALKSQTESQYQNARNNVISDMPAGGTLTGALVGLNSNRANALAQGSGAIAEGELARAMTLATGQTGQAMSGLSSAANTQAMVAQSEAEREAGMLGALGAGAGAYFGSKV